MKKLNFFVFAAIILCPFLVSAQSFPLLNNVYSINCSDGSVPNLYWAKSTDGEITRYFSIIKDNSLTYTALKVQKMKIEGNKIYLELFENSEKSIIYDVLEIKDGGKSYRLYERVVGTKEVIKNGYGVEPQGGETSFFSQCQPNTPAFEVLAKLLFPVITTADSRTVKKSPSEKCYLSIQGDQTIDSCDANTIKNSLAGYNRAILWKFKNASEIEFTAIYSNGEAKSFAEMTGGKVWDQIRTNIQSYKLNGNLITREIPAGSGCFITLTVEEKNGYRKEFFKSASPTCDSARVGANKLVSEGLRSGKDKGDRIINQ